jgi:hypothetical protein
MKLKTIHLENFQCIAGPITVDIAPLTLLFGANSAGKSAIADALDILSHLLNEKADVKTLARWIRDGADSMTIGLGYEVNDNELDDFLARIGRKNLIRRSIDDYLDIETDQGYSAAYYLIESARKAPNKKRGDKDELLESDCPTRIDLLFKFSTGPYTRQLGIPDVILILDGVELVSITEGGRYVDFNIKHPKTEKSVWRFWEVLIQLEIDTEILSEGFGDDISKYFITRTENSIRYKYLFEPMDGCGLRDGFAVGPRGSRMETLHVLDEDYLNGEDYEHVDDPLQEKYLDRNLNRNQVDSLDKMRWVFHGLVVIPARLGGALAASMLRLGPLRGIPAVDDLRFDYADGRFWADRYYKDEPHWDWDISRRAMPPLKNWKDGLAAWKYLAFNPEKLHAVNELLAAEKGLDVGYTLACHHYSVEPRPEPSRRYDFEVSEVIETPPPKGLPDGALGSQSFNVIHVRDSLRDFPVRVEDVGSGVSQCVPVLAALVKRQLVSFIEQPELHLHPRAQSRLGDVLINTALDTSFDFGDETVTMIETHSEHLALRVLRRLRENRNSANVKLSPESIVFYYFKKVEGTTTVHRIGVDAQGRFVDTWPDGFFEDRLEDLFT